MAKVSSIGQLFMDNCRLANVQSYFKTELEQTMKQLLFGLAAIAIIGIAAPASAQVFLGADSHGAGVQLGPLGVGVGPRFSDDGYRHRRGYDANDAYYRNCRTIRVRTVTRNGHVRYRMRRVCR